MWGLHLDIFPNTLWVLIIPEVKGKEKNVLSRHPEKAARGLTSEERWRKNQKEQRGTECFFQVQVACNYKAIKRRLHLEVKATWARDTASFFLWTYGITAPDGWRVIWEQNRHLLRMQMSLPLWVARDLQESWHFCRFRYLLIKPFKRGMGR